jgi:FdhE protein
MKPKPLVQIREVESATKNFPEYAGMLGFHKDLLRIILPLEKSKNKGARIELNEGYIQDLLEQALSSKKSLIKFIDPSNFEMEKISEIVNEIVLYLIEKSSDKRGLEKLLEDMRGENEILKDALKAIFKEDPDWFHAMGEKYQIEPSLLLMIFDLPLRPFFEELSRKTEDGMIEIWWETYCPVCGRTPRVAITRKRKRYMACSFCGTQYLVDLFVCTNCENNNPEKLGFIAFNDLPGYEVNYCEKCNKYIKILDEEKIGKRIPRGLEDLITQDLDVRAQSDEFKLSRN